MGGKHSHVLAVCLGSAVAAAAATLPAQASPPTTVRGIRFSIKLSTHRLSFGGAQALLSIRMQTGAHSQTAGIGLDSSNWPDRNVLGSPIAFGGPEISGAGRITGGFSTDGGGRGGRIPFCSRGPVNTGGGGQRVSLPPHSVTVISYPLRLSAPAWPGLRPTVGVWAYIPAMGHGARTYELGSRRLSTVGQSGIRISLSASRGITRVNRSGDSVAHHGARVLISGTTDPSIAGARLLISANIFRTQGPHETRVRIGSAVSASDGSFHIWWRVPRAGLYMVVAHLRHPGPDYLPDRGCDLSILVH